MHKADLPDQGQTSFVLANDAMLDSVSFESP